MIVSNTASYTTWKRGNVARNEIFKMITIAKEKYFVNLDQELSNPDQDTKSYWTVLKRLINKNKIVSIPPVPGKGLFINNVEK